MKLKSSTAYLLLLNHKEEELRRNKDEPIGNI